MKKLLYILFALSFFTGHSQVISKARYIGSTKSVKKYIGANQIPFNGDADANAFIAAVEGGGDVLDATQKEAITTLVSDLKAAGLWVELDAIYPFIGGTESSHKWNLKDARDLDVAYRITFVGTWIHNNNGADSDATTAYGNTHINIQSLYPNHRSHFSVYEKTIGIVNGRVNIGASNTIAWEGFVNLQIRNGSTRGYNPTFTELVEPTNSFNNYQGFHSISRTSTTNFIGFTHTNGVENNATYSTLETSVVAPNQSIFIGANNQNGSAASFQETTIAFITIGKALTLIQLQTLDDIIETYQDTLLRGENP